MGVPESWRYNGEVWRIYSLHDGEYKEVEKSPAFPLVPKVKPYEFLSTARQDAVDAELALRKWGKSVA